MGKIFRKFQIVFTIFLIIGFSIPIISLLLEYIPNPSIYQERKANMKIEYENIKPPVNANKVKETINSKVTRIWISSDYKVEMGKEDLVKYYQEELTKKGWNFEKVSHDGTFCFIKKDLLFELVVDNNQVHTSLHYNGDGPNF